MKNTYKVFWSDEAVKGLAEIIEYIEHRFSEKDVRKFVRLFEDTIELIRSNPEIFPLSKKSTSIRRSTVAKLTSIFYSIEGEKINIITVFDNRKNPKRLKFK